MSDLGPWINATVDHLKLHWQKHLPPAALFAGAALVLAMGLIFVFAILGFVVAIAAQGVDEEVLAIAMPIGILVMVVATIGISMLVIQPIYAGYVRYVLLLARGEEPQLSELSWGFKHLGSVLGLLFIQMALGFTGALFCYFPAFIVGGGLMFALPALVDRDLGAIDAVKQSWALARPRLASAVVVILLLTMASTVLSYLPIVGPMAVIACFVTLPVVAWVGLTEVPRDAPPEAPAER